MELDRRGIHTVHRAGKLTTHRPGSYALARGLISTFISSFCHVVYVFCLSSQPTLSGCIFMSKFQTILDRTVLVSAYARLGKHG